MKGRRSFSADEAAEIKRILREKVRADRGAQKRLRDRMRAIGFYIRDFATDQSGFTEDDFDRLVATGAVFVTGRPMPAGTRPQAGAGRSGERTLSRSDHSGAQARRLRQEAARKYRPSRVRILLVAEAPPNELSRYFYFEDVSEHDSLFRYVARGVLEEEPTRTNKARLLGRLKEKGVLLIDLMEDPKVSEDHSAHVEGLIRRCEELQPSAIILIKAPVYDASFHRLDDAGLPVVDERIPFPGSGQQRKFEEGFARALRAAERFAG